MLTLRQAIKNKYGTYEKFAKVMGVSISLVSRWCNCELPINLIHLTKAQSLLGEFEIPNTPLWKQKYLESQKELSNVNSALEEANETILFYKKSMKNLRQHIDAVLGYSNNKEEN